MAFPKRLTLALSFIVTLSACPGPKSAPGAAGDSSGQAPVVAPSEDQGTSSGGGSFGDESSNFILEKAKTSLALMLRRLHPSVFSELPSDWTADRIASVIENVKSEPSNIVHRYNRELMFDYRSPKDSEPEIIATSLFFRSHASIPIDTLGESQLEIYIQQVRIKLLHEVLHLVGIGTTEGSDSNARAFAKLFFDVVVTGDNFTCSTENVPARYPLFEDEDQRAARLSLRRSILQKDVDTLDLSKPDRKVFPYTWILNRASGGVIWFQDAPPMLVESPWKSDFKHLRQSVEGDMGNWPFDLSLRFLKLQNSDSLPNFSFEIPDGDSRVTAKRFAFAGRNVKDKNSFVFEGHEAEKHDATESFILPWAIKLGPDHLSQNFKAKDNFWLMGRFQNFGEDRKPGDDSFEVDCREIARPWGPIAPFKALYPVSRDMYDNIKKFGNPDTIIGKFQ